MLLPHALPLHPTMNQIQSQGLSRLIITIMTVFETHLQSITQDIVKLLHIQK